jgi:hypothetical protein
MPLATGVFNANTGNPAELNARSFAATLLRRFPNGSAPMFALTSQSGRSRAKASTHGYFSKTMAFLTYTLGAGVLIGATTVVVASTAGITVGMLFYNTRTMENVRVTAITNATDFVVTRAFGRVAAAAMNIGDKLINVGTAFEEGSSRPTARRLTTEYVPNFTQIFRNAWALTDTARASYAEMGISNIAENRQDCSMFHSVDIESAIIWGQASMDTTGTTPIHSTQGVLDAIEQYAPGNSNAAAATTTYEQLVALVEPAFQYSVNIGNPKERIAFGDSTAIKVLNQIGRLNGQITMTNSETKFGMRYTSFQFYKGTINLVEHPLMNGLGLTGTLLIMDMAALKLAYMDGRDTMPEEYGANDKVGSNGTDAVGGSLTTECAVELVSPYSCAVIHGLTAGAA